MTAKEVIEKLQKVPKNTECIIEYDNGAILILDTIFFQKDPTLCILTNKYEHDCSEEDKL